MNPKDYGIIGHEFMPATLYMAPAEMNLSPGDSRGFYMNPLPYKFSMAVTYIPQGEKTSPANVSLILQGFVYFGLGHTFMGHTFWASDEHDDVTKWKHFPRYWSFARGIHRSLVNFPHKFQ